MHNWIKIGVLSFELYICYLQARRWLSLVAFPPSSISMTDHYYYSCYYCPSILLWATLQEQLACRSAKDEILFDDHFARESTVVPHSQDTSVREAHEHIQLLPRIVTRLLCIAQPQHCWNANPMSLEPSWIGRTWKRSISSPPPPCPEEAAASHLLDTLKAPLRVPRASAGYRDLRGGDVFLGPNIVVGNLCQCLSFQLNSHHGTCPHLQHLAIGYYFGGILVKNSKLVACVGILEIRTDRYMQLGCPHAVTDSTIHTILNSVTTATNYSN